MALAKEGANTFDQVLRRVPRALNRRRVRHDPLPLKCLKSSTEPLPLRSSPGVTVTLYLTPFFRKPFRGSIAMVPRVATSIQKGLSKLSP
jgi:hypothetical protein